MDTGREKRELGKSARRGMREGLERHGMSERRVCVYMCVYVSVTKDTHRERERESERARASIVTFVLYLETNSGTTLSLFKMMACFTATIRK